MGIFSVTTTISRAVRKIGLAGGLALLLAPVAVGATGAISQGYKTNSTEVTKGVLLSLVASSSTEVEPANNDNVTNLIGVAADKPLVELSAGQNNAQVVVNGSTEALVSNLNGDVKAGDKITASPVSGIGMKALEATEIVGTAQAGLDTVTTVARTVTDKDGKTETIKVGLLPIGVNVSHYSAPAAQGTIASFVPPFLQSVANTIAGRQVTPIRVLLGAAALLLGFIAIIVILSTAIRSGLISLGRNPLAQGALRKGLVDVIIAAMGLLVITTVVVYVVLVV
ncbi:MAG TPA: hypothetical protein VJR27_04550 [Candidatus Saccharimonadales bacterium]|nr:hypothetical protein [Candidatus Saccharimonadales bacterium]